MFGYRCLTLLHCMFLFYSLIPIVFDMNKLNFDNCQNGGLIVVRFSHLNLSINHFDNSQISNVEQNLILHNYDERKLNLQHQNLT